MQFVIGSRNKTKYHAVPTKEDALENLGSDSSSMDHAATPLTDEIMYQDEITQLTPCLGSHGTLDKVLNKIRPKYLEIIQIN